MRLASPKINLYTARNFLLIAVVAVVAFSGGFLVANVRQGKSLEEVVKVTISREKPKSQETLDFSLFWKVWDTLTANYYDKTKLKDSEMVYGAIKGLVSSIGDPYTVFLTPSENKVVEEDLQGSFDGVGIQIGFRGTRLAVIAPLPGSPAEEKGVKPGDFIIGIKDEAKDIDRATDGMSLQEAVQAIRGKAGTKVTLALIREGVNDPIIVELERKNIDVPSVVVNFVGDDKNIAQIKVLKFSEETTDEWRETVSEVLATDNLKGIVVDVRNNPGGYLQGAIDLSSEFLKFGSVVVIEDGKNGLKREYKVDRIGKFLEKPVVVLINKGSASASEIFAGALRDDRKIKLIGDTSFGKGTIQEPLQVNGAGLHITTSRWLTPAGTWVNEKGLEPDIKIEDKEDTAADEQLEKAISQL